MNGPIRHLAAGIFIVMLLLALNVTVVQAVLGPGYRDHPDNPRLALGLAGKERGLIVSADGEVLARSVANPDQPRIFSRQYPFGDLYAHAVGYTSFLFGDTGLESAYADQLRSQRDLTISDLLDALLGEDLRAQNIQSTLHHSLQVAATEALGDQQGSVVALDPMTGAVLAYVSHPTFDPASLSGRDPAGTRERLDGDPSQPLLDRVAAQTYAPGSTFKVVTAAAGIEEGVINPESTFEDVEAVELPGSTATIRNADRGPCSTGIEVTIEVAFRNSCNTVFAQLALDLGPEPILTRAESFGFNRELPFDLRSLVSAYPETDDLAAVAQNAIGERDVQATPLQMALVAAVVANEGVAMQPHLVRNVVDADGQILDTQTGAEFRRATSPGTARVLSNLMEQVVISGTGQAAQIPSVRVAGKTGTAQAGATPSLWFIGFAPVEAPSIAVAVIVEAPGETGSGGSVAAPIARSVIASWLQVEQ